MGPCVRSQAPVTCVGRAPSGVPRDGSPAFLSSSARGQNSQDLDVLNVKQDVGEIEKRDQ